MTMTVVTFNTDQYPYCKGDEVNLSDDELKVVDAEADKRGVDDTYTVKKGAAKQAAPDETVASDEVETPVETKTDTPKVKDKKAKGGK